MKHTITLLSLFVAFIPLFAQESAGLEPMDIAKIEIVTNAIISEDGKTVIYSRAVPADPLKENKSAQLHLFKLDVASEESTPFVTQGSASQMAFRPEHSSVTFLSKRENDDGSALY